MKQQRNGISFTLTMVVAGTILLISALAITTSSGLFFDDFFGTTEDLREQAQDQTEPGRGRQGSGTEGSPTTTFNPSSPATPSTVPCEYIEDC